MTIFKELQRRNVFRVAVAYTIGAWFLAQIADLVLNNIGAPDWVIKALFLLLGLGFVVALIISWAYEITPEGVKRERDVVRDESITHLTAKKLDYITLAAVIGAVGLFLFQKNVDDQPATGIASVSATAETSLPTGADALDAKSIAVLPFANRSNLDEDLFFTDGIHDDLLTQLAKISDLKVISRTSVMQYRDTDKRVPQIAEELGVATVLEGGVQRAGKRIRINAQLIDVATDQHIWAETFDREMTIDNLFDIQTEITRQIVTAVKGQLTSDDQKALSGAPTQSLEAYEAYLRARNLLTSSGYNIDKYQEAQPYAEQAIAIDPNFALAQLLLAEIHGHAAWMGYGESPQRQQAARAAMDRAAAVLDAGSPELLAAQGEYLYRFERDYPAALDSLLQAHVAMPGDASILDKLGYTQRRLGLWDEAVDNLLQSFDLDPANVSALSTAAETLRAMQQWSRVEDVLAMAPERFRNDASLASTAALLPLWSKGDVVAARERYANVRPDVSTDYFLTTTEIPWYERDYAGVIDSLGRPEVLKYAVSSGSSDQRILNLALAHGQLGETARADQLLGELIERLADIDREREPATVSYELTVLAEALALQGEKSRSIAIAEEATRLYTYASDKYEGTYPLMVLCKVLALTGERDRALEILAQLIDQPGGFVRWAMYLDPRWDFFRDDERFNELIRPKNLEQSIHAKDIGS